VHRKRGWPGLCPDPAGGAYSTPSNPLAQLRALLLKGREGRGGEVERQEGEEDGLEVRKRRGSGTPTFGEKVMPLLKTKLQPGSM